MSAWLVIDGNRMPNCPKCHMPPRLRREGEFNVIECCGITARGKALSKAAKRWRERTARAEWDKALGNTAMKAKERDEARRLMANDTVAEKRLNAFHDGRLMR